MAITRENIAHFYEKYKENLKTEESVIEQFTKADTKENWVAFKEEISLYETAVY